VKRILLTGGSGFIGRNLVEAWRGRYEVLAPKRSELDLLDDAAVRAYMRRNPVDAVVHSATTPGHRNAPKVDNLAVRNLRMFANAARNEDCFGRFIFLGSGAEYDSRHYLPRMREDYFDAHVPADEHGLSKYACAKWIERSPKMVNLRLFGVFGPHEDYEIRFISNAICKALAGRPITIKQNRRFDYLFVHDLAPVIEHFIEREPRHRSYNVTPDQSVELRTLAELVRDVSGRPLEIVTALDGLGPEYSGDNSRLKAELPGWKTTPIRQAIEKLYRWYEAHPGLIRPEALLVDK
jgi:GDP-L-fucose synthase